ncbi:glutamyl-tRNA reductase [Nakamurella sp. YIM 132087]|uniref:Glutamyl-tRNA reductase n=1 Tax=Nakamurella alba TaxID=2665158 RepID=A0A7K1FGA4_9ACTN|nr:glutamyl-tRNA reductase [Nakamurella alba]MTD13155.1 glutamyl-tRNA reductase [Nakamurella alba]
MLMVLGASHHDLELSELDRLSARSAQLRSGIAELVGSDDSPVAGGVVIATCNRLEIYLDTARFHDAIDAVTALVADVAGLDPADAASSLKVRVGAPVAAHLFTVAAGLDSMVVGEAEISGQVSRALAESQAAGAATTVLNSLFQKASRTAKKVASATSLGGAGRSVASVALDLALADGSVPASALIVGTGAYARVVATALRARGCAEFLVHSPSGRAEAFAATHHATAIDADGLVKAVATVDLVIGCSGTGRRSLSDEVVAEAVALRESRLRVLDLALHSDLGPGVRGMDGVDVTDLHTVAEGVAPEHHDTVVAAQDIVIDAVARFEEDQAVRTLDPAVVALREHVSSAVQKEMGRFRSKYGDLSDDLAADVELAMHRVTQSLLHTPTLRARELARTGSGQDYVQALHTLFGIRLPDGSDQHS